MWHFVSDDADELPLSLDIARHCARSSASCEQRARAAPYEQANSIYTLHGAAKFYPSPIPPSEYVNAAHPHHHHLNKITGIKLALLEGVLPYATTDGASHEI